MDNSSTIIKYIDLFGTRCTFYSEKMPKLYTVTGGVFSILSILACIFIFMVFSLDDLKRKYPNITTSSIPSEGYRKIKFGEEKIWIPWRIVDYNNNEFVNHTGVLFPIIYYISGKKEHNSKDFNLSYVTLNYTLCSETSMAERTDIYYITVPLNELYCIDMEDLFIGGSWISEFINYVKFDLYYCKNGISYDELNENCSSFDKIINFIGKNNSLEVDIYYPVVQFQPTNKTYPVIVIYQNHFYHLSRYSNKIERIFLQEHVLTDNSGWVLDNEENNSYWGLNAFNGDTYFNGKEKDLINEGSNSRAYSFNIYLEPGIILYKRYYKKIYTIISDFFPIAYVIFIVMKNISKLFKNTETNRRMIELLFENLKEKPNIFENNLQKLTNKNNGKNSINKDNNGISSFNSLNNKSINQMKKSKFGLQQFKTRYGFHHSSLVLKKNDLYNNNNKSSNNQSSNRRSSNKLSSRSKKNVNSKFYDKHKKIIINNTSDQNLIYYDLDYNNNNLDHLKNFKKHMKPISNNNFIKQQLFPYRYYLCSIFIKNLNAKENVFFSSRFLKIYAFLCQLFDITTYLLLLREFNALKKIYNEKHVNLIDRNKKININSKSFIKNINDCIEEQKFYILAQGVNK